MAENEAEDPDYWCDKSPKTGKNKGKFCGGNLRHPGKCGPWFEDDAREEPVDKVPSAEDESSPNADVIPFRQPTEIHGEADPEIPVSPQKEELVPPFSQPGQDEATAEIQFRQPAKAPVFEEPDLRGPDGYQHPVTGKKVPGVTTISGLIDKSGHLVPWSAKLAAEWAGTNADLLADIPDVDSRVAAIRVHADRMRHEGRDLGSLAHNTIEAILRGEDVQVHPSVQPQVDGFYAWREEFVQQIILVEGTVWSELHGYAGTMDIAVVLKNGLLACVDFKTGKDVYPDAALQVNALMFAESIITTGGQVDNLPFAVGGVLHLPQPVLTATGRPSTRGNWSYRPIARSTEEFEVFLALRRAHLWEKGRARDVLGGKQTKLPAVAGQ